MADRLDYYFRQRLSEAELDLAFELLEKADRDLAADLNVFGIISGAEPAPHSPVEDLTIDLTAPARAYDRQGRRIAFGTGQRVNCAVDLVGNPTDVLSPSNEAWLGVFLRFDRALSDPRTDGNSQVVMFRRDESFQIVVRRGIEAPVGLAERVPLQPDELLVCDVRRRHGQTQILLSDIDTSRRQVLVFVQSNSVAVDPSAWTRIAPLVGTVQSAFDAVDAVITDHLNGSPPRHLAVDIVSNPTGFVSATNVQDAIEEITSGLASTATGDSGASRVGAQAVSGTPNALSAGTVASQLQHLLSVINAHVADTSGAHTAGSIDVVDSPGLYVASNVEAALSEVMSAFKSGHFTATESSTGLHRTIQQPVLQPEVLGDTRVILWHAEGVGAPGSRFRVYMDDESVWFTINALWSDVPNWQPDNSAFGSSAIRLRRSQIEFMYSVGVSAFSTWQRSWALPMSSTTNTGFEVAGTVQEQGRVALAGTNSFSSTRTIEAAGACTFRARFPTTPSSITLQLTNASAGYSGTPDVLDANRDGFIASDTQSQATNTSFHWFGNYTAIA